MKFLNRLPMKVLSIVLSLTFLICNSGVSAVDNFKIALIGNPGAGKREILNRFAGCQYTEIGNPETKQKKILMDGFDECKDNFLSGKTEEVIDVYNHVELYNLPLEKGRENEFNELIGTFNEVWLVIPANIFTDESDKGKASVILRDYINVWYNYVRNVDKSIRIRFVVSKSDLLSSNDLKIFYNLIIFNINRLNINGLNVDKYLSDICYTSAKGNWIDSVVFHDVRWTFREYLKNIMLLEYAKMLEERIDLIAKGIVAAVRIGVVVGTVTAIAKRVRKKNSEGKEKPTVKSVQKKNSGEKESPKKPNDTKRTGKRTDKATA